MLTIKYGLRAPCILINFIIKRWAPLSGIFEVFRNCRMALASPGNADPSAMRPHKTDVEEGWTSQVNLLAIG